LPRIPDKKFYCFPTIWVDMRLTIKIAAILSFILIFVLAFLVYIPRVVFGPPKQGWLTFSLCQIPCWRNIRPGQTIFRNAETLLERMPDITTFAPIMTNSRRILAGRFTINIEGNPANGTINTLSPAPTPEEGLVANITFNNLLTTRLIDVIDQIGSPSRAGVIREEGRGALLMIDFQAQHVSALAAVSESTLNQLCVMGFEYTYLDYIILHDGTPTAYPGTRWGGYDRLSQTLCDPGR